LSSLRSELATLQRYSTPVVAIDWSASLEDTKYANTGFEQRHGLDWLFAFPKQHVLEERKSFLAFYPGEHRKFSVREHRFDVWKKRQQFLREYMSSALGRSSTSLDEVDFESR
jgi:hypothetical protein